MDKNHIRIQEVAKILGRSVDHAYRVSRYRHFPAVAMKIGQVKFWYSEDIKCFAAMQKIGKRKR